MWNRKALFDGMRPMFDGHFNQGQVDGINVIMDEIEIAKISDAGQVAYILATTVHETNHTMLPVREAYWVSEAWRKAHLRYYPFYGRGYVQLTWETNYKYCGTALGLDLVGNPDLAMEPRTAAAILVRGMRDGWFAHGQLLDRYIKGSYRDYKGARQIVNGTDEAEKIADYARTIEDHVLIEAPPVTGIPPESLPVSVQTGNGADGSQMPPAPANVPQGLWEELVAMVIKWFSDQPPKGA